MTSEYPTPATGSSAVPGEPATSGEPATEGAPAEDVGRGEPPRSLPLMPGFREMALRRMSAERRRLVADLAARRQAAGLSQTEVAARMGTSQSAVARLEAGGVDVRASTLERYAAAVGGQIIWQLRVGEARGSGAGGAAGNVTATTSLAPAPDMADARGSSGRSHDDDAVH